MSDTIHNTSTVEDSADELEKFVRFAPGVIVRRYSYFDEYKGTPQDCVTAGVISADKIPGIPGHPRKLSATYRNGVLAGKGSQGPKDESYMFVRIAGKQVVVWCGVPVEVREKRSKVQSDAFRAKRQAENDTALKVRIDGTLANCELTLMPVDIQTHRQQIIDDLRTNFRSTSRNKIQNRKQGFFFDESAYEMLDEMLDQMIEVVLGAEIKFDAKVQRARVQDLRAVIAAADPAFKRSIATISDGAKKTMERSEA